MKNEERDRHLYKYPNSDVLKNKLGIQDQKILDEAERSLVTNRIREGVPSGNFDLKHLQDIHKHLFQDIYGWAGEIRQVHIHKGTSSFVPPDKIRFAMQDVHNRIKQQNYLRELKKDAFAKEAGKIIGDINHVHPFREGNGRTQLQYLELLGKKAGHNIQTQRIKRDEWIQASIEANDAKYDRMSQCINDVINSREREQETNKKRRLEILKKHTPQQKQSRRRSKEKGRDIDR